MDRTSMQALPEEAAKQETGIRALTGTTTLTGTMASGAAGRSSPGREAALLPAMVHTRARAKICMVLNQTEAA